MVFRILAILFFFTFSSVNAQVLNIENFINNLSDTDQISIFDHPTVEILRSECTSVGVKGVENHTEFMCDVVMKSETCNAVPEEQQLDCSKYDESLEFDTIDFFAGCVEGLFDAAVEIIEFIWSALKWAWNAAVNYQDTFNEASEYMDSVKLYLVNEYDKAYEKAEWPFRSAKAAKAVAGKIVDKVFGALQEVLYREYKELGCMNFKARTQTMCKFAGEFVVPPTAIAMHLLKKGSKGVKLSSEMKGKIKDLKKEDGIKEIPNAPPPNGVTLTGNANYDDFRIAFVQDKLVGDKRLISYIGADGDRYPGRIVEKQGNKLLIETPQGQRYVLEGEALKQVKLSQTAQQAFREVPDKLLLRASGSSATDAFRKGFNKGNLRGDDTFISFTEGPERLPGRVVEVRDRSVIVEDVDGRRFELSEDRLGDIRLSNTAKSEFARANPPMKLETLGKPGFDEFRSAFNRGKFAGNERYISYMDGPDRLAVKVIQREGDKLLVENIDGYKYMIDETQVKSAKLSETARIEFEKVARWGSDVVRSTRPLKPLDTNISSPSYLSFRTNFNKGVFKGDDVFVSVPYGAERRGGQIIEAHPDRIVLNVIDDDGIKRRMTIQSEDLDTVRTSHTTKDAFHAWGQDYDTLDEITIKGQRLNHYEQRGFAVDLNLDSPGLKKWVGEATDIIERETGLTPNMGRPLTGAERHRLQQAWLQQVVKRVESRESFSQYGNNRSLAAKRNAGRADLGQIIEEGKAVCLELSMFASTVFAQYGVKSKLMIGKTNLRAADPGKHGYHAWLQIVDDRGRPLEIMDSNNSRSIHPDFEDYHQRLNGVEIERGIDLIQI